MPTVTCAGLCDLLYTLNRRGLYAAKQMTNTVLNRLAAQLVNPAPRSLSIGFADAARLTGVSQRTLRRLAAQGKLRTTKLGARRVVSVASLQELVQ